VTPSFETVIATGRARLATDAPVVGVGWATVDLERAEASFGLAFEDATDDAALGARCRIAGMPDGTRLVLLEPSTEGRLAESLARRGEGPVAVWFDDPLVTGIDPATPTAGPFGPERLVPGGARHEPHLFLVERPPATINA
jgi:hypothetical protein